MHLVERLKSDEGSNALLELENAVADRLEVREVARERDGFELRVARLLHRVAVQKQVGNNVVDGNKVVGIGGDGELVAFDNDAICERKR